MTDLNVKSLRQHMGQLKTCKCAYAVSKERDRKIKKWLNRGCRSGYQRVHRGKSGLFETAASTRRLRRPDLEARWQVVFPAAIDRRTTPGVRETEQPQPHVGVTL